jgi:F0F1-type ATP synthase assembly protein I
MKPPDFLKLVALWSLIPTYLLAGGGIGYGLDRWLHTFPLFTGVGIVVAFGFAIRDMLRLHNEIFDRKQ